MPTDIRSFFGKKGGATLKPKAKPAAGAPSAKDSSKSAAKTNATKKQQVAPNESNEQKADKKKQVITLNEDDNESTTDEANDTQPAPSKQRNKKKALRIEEDDEDSDATTDDKGPTANGKPQKQQLKAPPRAKSTSRTEISASDYFSKSSDSRKKKAVAESPVKEPKAVSLPRGQISKPAGHDDLLDDSDDDRPSKKLVRSAKGKKRPQILDSDDDGGKDGENYQENENDEDEDDDDDSDFEILNKDQNKKRSPVKSVEKSLAKKQKPNSPLPDQDMDNVEEPTGKKSRSTTPSRASSKRDSTSKSPNAEVASPTRKKQKTPASKKKKEEKPKPLAPTLELEQYDTDKAVPECMKDLTFVFSGNLPNLQREEAADFVKTLGARVTTAVSSKTTYLVVGEILENGLPYTEGSKYKKAMTFDGAVQVVKGEPQLYGLAKLYSDKAAAIQSIDKENDKAVVPSPGAAAAAAPIASAPANPYKKPVNNPYAKKPGALVNPYAKKPNNPLAKPSTSSNPYAKPSGGASPKAAEAYNAPQSDPNSLWVDRYAPQNTRQILGNKDCVNKLSTWLARWEDRFNNQQAIGKTFSSPQGPWKAALLSGPPGIGKTTTATLVAKEAGRDLLEYNASDVRSKKAMHESLGDITGSQSMEGFFHATAKGPDGKQAALKTKGKCIIMDEVDGMGGGDRGGVAELIQMIKGSRVPVICICNDRQNQKLKSLIPYCLDLRFKRPIKTMIAKQAVDIAAREGLQVERNAAEAIAESCGNDIRQVVNALQMWASDSKGQSGNTMTYKELKDRAGSINKDEILRVSLFDAVRMVLEGRKGLANADPVAENNSFFKRCDAYFVDYNFTGLLVQQNYLKVMTYQHNEAKRANDENKVVDFMARMSEAASSMSDFAMVENKIRGGDMNWSLLPFAGVLAVKTGFHASGPTGGMLPGFPEFTAWLGKNSAMGKRQRILQELKKHMNFKISGGSLEVRLSYLPFMRERLLALLSNSNDDCRNALAIEIMDGYGLNREDVFESFDEFLLAGSKAPKFADLDSKSKAAFTREYNKLSHKSQALVEEQGVVKKKRGGAGGGNMESVDPDAIDDDKVEEEEQDDDDDDDEDMAKIQAAFKKKGRTTAAKAAGGKKGSVKGRKKK